MNKTMYDIREEHLSLVALIEDADGEITDEQVAALSLTEEQFKEKAVSVCYVYKMLCGDYDLIEKEVKRLQKILKTYDMRREWLKNGVSDAMKQFKVEKIKTPFISLYFTPFKAVVIDDEDEIPDNMKVVVPETKEISKTLIKAAIERGEDVPGATLETRKNLVIR